MATNQESSSSFSSSASSPSNPFASHAPAASSVNRHLPTLLPDSYMRRRTSLPLAVVSELSPTGSSLSPRRIHSFSRPGSIRRRNSVPREVDNSQYSPRTIEVRVPAFETVEVDRSQIVDSNGSTSFQNPSNDELQQQQQLVMDPKPYEVAKTLLISATGQCSTKPDLPTEERESDDEAASSPTAKDFRFFGHDSNFGPGYAHGDHSGPNFFGPFGSIFSCWKLRFRHSFSKLLHHTASPFHYWLRQRVSDKKINVDKDVLSTYHESFLYGKVSFSTRVRAGLRGPFLGRVLLVLECIAGLLLLGLYVRTTYTAHTAVWITNVQLCCSSFFMLDYLIKFYSAPVRIYYALSLNGIIDFISVLPVFFILSGVMENAAIPQVFLVFRVLRAVPFLSSWALPGGAVSQEIFMLASYSIGVFVFAAGVLQWVEWRATSASDRESRNCTVHSCMTFYDAFYFVIVTVSTVGYGDITLKSDWGRVISILIIVAAVVLIPMEVNKILDLASRRPYGGNFTVQKVLGSRLIIISGNLTYRAVEDFLSEFYHPSHAEDMRAFPLRMIIMAPFKPSFEMKVLLTEYKGRVEFIEGTPLKDSDLNRVSANIASAFFLMADHLAEDPDAEDAAQIMRALSVHRYCGSKVRLIVEMLKPENQDNPVWDDADGGIEIVCPEAICYQLLARSCQIKGLSTLVINLFKAGLKVENPIPSNWMQKYCHGQQQEIYPVILPACFHEHDLTFEEIVEIVYVKFEIILFGLDIVIEDGIREVVLFPKQRLIQKTDIGLVIADDLSAAEKISKICVHCMPPWYIRMYKKIFNRGFKTTYERDDSLIHTVMKKRESSYRYSDGLGPLGSGNRRDSREKKSSESFGMMSAGHRADLQTQLREIVLASNLHEINPKAAHHFVHRAAKQQEQITEEHHVCSLEEAVDLITTWPPVKPEKPDFPVFEKRAIEILNCLDERTLTIVNLTKPHILLCVQRSWPSNIFCFIAHLRTPTLPNPPIVILHPCRPSIAEWGCVGMFKDVYFVKGSPLHEIDLVRAGALQADKVVILSPRGTNNDDTGLNADDRSLSPSSIKIDMENVLITATVERVTHPVKGHVMVEVHQETQIHYLRPKLRINPHRFDKHLYNRNRSATFLFAPAFVEGKAFCSASLTFLLYALFFNRNTVSITEKLISGGDVLENEDGSERLVGARLDQVIVPKAYEGRTFGEMFVGLLRDQQWLSLGLYRNASRNSLVSFVYTNPPASEILLPRDLVYVLRT